jgi:hypothetical protein
VTFAGAETTGGLVSLTVMENVIGPVVSPLTVFVAVHDTVVTPIGNVSPELWSHETEDGPLSSVAVTVNVATAPAADVASSVWSETGSNTGGRAPARGVTNASSAASPAATTRQALPKRSLPGPRIPQEWCGFEPAATTDRVARSEEA